MSHELEFSVIIPVFNRQHLIKRTLISVAQQTHRPIQLILVDNNSTDGSLQVLRQFQAKYNAPDFEIVVTQEFSPGASAARAAGARLATRPWLVFFDSDDVMLPNLISNYARAIEQSPQASVVITNALKITPDGKQHHLHFHTDHLLENHLLHAILATQRYAITRSLYEQTGGWNEQLPAWNDWELGVRILCLNPSCASAFAQQPQVLWFTGADTITGTDFSSKAGVWERSIDAVESILSNANMPDKQRNRLLLLLNHRRATLAAAYLHEGHSHIAWSLRKKAVSSTHSLWHKIVLNIAFLYATTGLRGASVITTSLA